MFTMTLDSNASYPTEVLIHGDTVLYSLKPKLGRNRDTSVSQFKDGTTEKWGHLHDPELTRVATSGTSTRKKPAQAVPCYDRPFVLSVTIAIAATDFVLRSVCAARNTASCRIDRKFSFSPLYGHLFHLLILKCSRLGRKMWNCNGHP